MGLRIRRAYDAAVRSKWRGIGTAVLDILHCSASTSSGGGQQSANAAAWPTSTLTRWKEDNVQDVEVRIRLNSDTLEHWLESWSIERATRYIAHWARNARTNRRLPAKSCRVNAGEAQLCHDIHEDGPEFTVDWSESVLGRFVPNGSSSRIAKFMDFMRRMTICGLRPSIFRAESLREDPLLSRSGDNFPDWYRHVLQERPDVITPFTDSLRQVIGDGFSGIRLERVGLDARGLMAAFHGFDRSDNSVPYELRFDELSDGQRVLIVLYGLIHFATVQGSACFVDEPENFVALAEIQPWLTALADICGEALPQAVLCSHHPELIDYLGGDCGLLLEREASGAVTARRPQAHHFEGGLKFSELIARGWER